MLRKQLNTKYYYRVKERVKLSNDILLGYTKRISKYLWFMRFFSYVDPATAGTVLNYWERISKQ